MEAIYQATTGSRRQRVRELLEDPPESFNRQIRRFLVSEVDADDWETHHDQLIKLTELLIKCGKDRDAVALLLSAEDEEDVRIRQLHAHVMRKTGSPSSAAAVLTTLVEEGHGDDETYGFLGSAEKHLARGAPTLAAARPHWKRARDYYAKTFEASNDTYHGINVAAISLRLGNVDAAHKAAANVEAACHRLLDSDKPVRDWTLATLGESYLIQGQIDAALDAYAAFVEAHPTEINTIGTTLREARGILDDLGLESTLLDNVFRLPDLVVFSGHRIDHVDRNTPRLPPESLDQIKAALKRYLKQNNIRVGTAAAADGSDILFLEALMELGGEIHVILPVDVESFRKYSVIGLSNHNWMERFDRIVSEAETLTITGDETDPDFETDLNYCNQVTLGLSRILARGFATGVSALTVWDGKQGFPGGTADALAFWSRHQVPYTVLNPLTGDQSHPAPPKPSNAPPKRRIMAMLFADIIGYGRLTEREIDDYYAKVLPEIAALADGLDPQPVVQDSFGDAFHWVIEDVPEAAEFALGLQAIFNDERRSSVVDTPLKIRIALHAGPVRPHYDPIRKAMNYTGRHNIKAARMEPVADPNQILTTQQFAALLHLDAHTRFELTYAGEKMLAKGYGSEHLYVLTSPTMYSKVLNG
ncbi:MAG: hypothetical protein O7H39_02560 [Gammaproteobacteria bacterium]|nr:hypothetical protein [Gammaproteobacteria bacterium]